ncbi:unnamed protein product, partial [Symbiodinium sp. KB8]
MACAALASQRLLRRLPVLGARALKAQALAVAVPLRLPTVARLVGAQACSTQASSQLSEPEFHDLADKWINALEEHLEALDEVLGDDVDLSNA